MVGLISNFGCVFIFYYFFIIFMTKLDVDTILRKWLTYLAVLNLRYYKVKNVLVKINILLQF